MSSWEALLDSKYDTVRKATYLALDVPDVTSALQLVDDFFPVVDGYKVGLELFHAAGMNLVEQLLKRNARVFLDMKLHDIPNTVHGALRAICQAPIEMVNVHAQGGQRMLSAAREAVDASPCQPLLIGVTILTSMDRSDLQAVGIEGTPEAAVERLTNLCIGAGLDGVVCSAEELDMLAKRVPVGFERVVPGTRLAMDSVHDQRRSRSPGEAMRSGATRLVLGRAIVQASDRLSALEAYWSDMLEGDSQA
ncbi:orotidine-5'-phosphate decarboxylase [Alicyclobacillus dauci]|uniref:Orotidine 5'-phosphate decarboxylase n=1 Tax=Alicyclobacillus dauci TaxID=1475485 RepID=A0ABY6YZ14_9BACL|nr:orotidine-5'-phosphate decarboxylase [Alicyclobacillus dauci]WAH35508.1 orotidine-5'-phosphate decarboxylase [Alicyclobacillus dauci]